MFFTLRNRLFLIFTCLLTIPFILLSIIIPSWFTTIIRDQAQDLTIEMMDQYLLYVDSITTQAEDLGKQVLINETTQEWLRLEKENGADDETLLVKNELRRLLSSMMVNNSNFMSISVLLYDGTGIWGSNPDLDEEEWFQDFIKNEQQFAKSHIDQLQPYPGEINSYILPLFDTNTLEDGYFTEVNERGTRLSSGQRQLISFAGALLADPKILILDEATSSIDTETELALQKGLETLLSGRTSFIIAHRLSTIKNATKILYIENGRIIEKGTHNELMEMKGHYWKLSNSQGHSIEAG
ncbi:ABC transporter family protein [Halalkalibacter nanhaiisediminis]|uniref:ABC transporter family protein n=1 Tax=Halalkalibacter nanhaiisediminis TaxID=688079 RepID=A0A562QGX2_9BACI|nr:ABC transporter family protein [Halalkalibacter nanhaiisediminis]